MGRNGITSGLAARCLARPGKHLKTCQVRLVKPMRILKLILVFSSIVLLALLVTAYIYFGVDWSLTGPTLLRLVFLIGLYWMVLIWAAYQTSFQKSIVGVAIVISLLLLLYVLDMSGARTTSVLILAGLGRCDGPGCGVGRSARPARGIRRRPLPALPIAHTLCAGGPPRPKVGPGFF